MEWKCYNCSHLNNKNCSICSNCLSLMNKWTCPQCNNKYCNKYNNKCSDCGYVKKNIRKNINPKVQDNICPICLEDINYNNYKITYCSNTCGSLVHLQCQKNWCQVSSTCSVCKSHWEEFKLIKLN
jgi:hypothetical protein